jgi:hypothetical protein
LQKPLNIPPFFAKTVNYLYSQFYFRKICGKPPDAVLLSIIVLDAAFGNCILLTTPKPLNTMKKLITCLAIFLSASTSFSQDSLRLRRIVLKTKITDSNNQLQRAFLHTLADSGLYLSKVPVRINTKQLDVSTVTWVPYKDIAAVELKKRGSAVTGAILGAIGGGIIGAILGAASYTKPEPNAYLNLDFGPGLPTLGGAVIGMGSGALLGVVTSALIKKKFIIKGRKERFTEMHNRMLRRLFITRPD